MLKLLSNGVPKTLSHHLIPFIPYSTSTSPNFKVEYLITTLGFSRQEALAASTKVSRLKSPENPNSVISLFRQLGITQSQIKTIVSRNANVLSVNSTAETLAPKIRVFQDLGFSGADLGAVLASNPTILSRKLEVHILPLIEILRSILGSDENVVKTIKKSFMLITSNVPKRILKNVELYRSFGLPEERIKTLVLRNPRNLTGEPRVVERVLRDVEEKLGIPRDSKMFIHGVDVMSSIGKDILEAKLRVFKGYGWTEEEMVTMARNLPHCLMMSEAKIRRGLDFFMRELGYEPHYLCGRPKLLMYSMEKRVLPRKALWEALKERKLIKTKSNLHSVLGIVDGVFVKKYVLPFRNELPELCEAYIKNRSSMSIA